jgi:Protein of unknown function (DUF1573)
VSLVIGKSVWESVFLVGLITAVLLQCGLTRRTLYQVPSSPSIYLSTHSVNVGRLRPSQEAESSVSIENRGGRPLLLEEPTASCGCQKPILDRNVLGPGERTELRVRQSATSEIGPFQHAVFIRTNDPETPITSVFLKGVITRGLSVRPEPLIFAPVSAGETSRRFLEIYSDDGKPFSLTHKNVAEPLLVKAKLNSPATLHRLEVSLRAPTTFGSFRSNIFIDTDFPDGDPLLIDVAYEVVGPIRIIPSPLMLGTVRGYEEIQRKIVLSSCPASLGTGTACRLG